MGPGLLRQGIRDMLGSWDGQDLKRWQTDLRVAGIGEWAGVPKGLGTGRGKRQGAQNARRDPSGGLPSVLSRQEKTDGRLKSAATEAGVAAPNA